MRAAATQHVLLKVEHTVLLLLLKAPEGGAQCALCSCCDSVCAPEGGAQCACMQQAAILQQQHRQQKQKLL